MFSTLKSRLLLGIYIFLIISIPVGAYLASETTSLKSRASEQDSPTPTIVPKPSTSATQELLDSSESKINVESLDSDPTPEPEADSPTIATSFGPTLSLKATLEGRPADNQTTKLFVGIIEGAVGSSSPKFLLSFTVDLPANGTYDNLSLAGLTAGNSYTALLKGSAQLASSITFTMSPTVTNLNDGQAVNLYSGDLNEDNVVNSADLSIAQKAVGSTSSSSNWNELADLNADGRVNSFDLAIINANLDKIGASGAWTSPIPAVGTPSASLKEPSAQGGYWIWIPR